MTRLWPSTLTIADGTNFETVVWDMRGAHPWSKYAAFPRRDQPRLIVYHHSATTEVAYGSVGEWVKRLKELTAVSPYGLPYNFVIGSAPGPAIAYLNDIDGCWPHTLGHNDAVAICALGNYQTDRPAAQLVGTMTRLADALASMWGFYVPECAHLQLHRTACPGQHLYAALDLARDLTPPA